MRSVGAGRAYRNWLRGAWRVAVAVALRGWEAGEGALGRACVCVCVCVCCSDAPPATLLDGTILRLHSTIPLVVLSRIIFVVSSESLGLLQYFGPHSQLSRPESCAAQSWLTYRVAHTAPASSDSLVLPTGCNRGHKAGVL